MRHGKWSHCQFMWVREAQAVVSIAFALILKSRCQNLLPEQTTNEIFIGEVFEEMGTIEFLSAVIPLGKMLVSWVSVLRPTSLLTQCFLLWAADLLKERWSNVPHRGLYLFYENVISILMWHRVGLTNTISDRNHSQQGLQY